MDVGSISHSALSGINKGINQANEASSKLASADQLSKESSTQDTANNIIELKQAELQVQASAKVAQTAGDIIGSIIDIKA